MELADAHELRGRLGTLPQELYNLIFDFVFTAEPGAREITVPRSLQREMNAKQRARRMKAAATRRQDLKLMNISQATRARYAKSYYCDRVVFLEESDWSCKHLELGTNVVTWLEMLNQDHRAMIYDVTLVMPTALRIGETLRGRKKTTQPYELRWWASDQLQFSVEYSSSFSSDWAANYWVVSESKGKGYVEELESKVVLYRKQGKWTVWHDGSYFL